ncbi:MAG TPA: Rrf2 family transcriptional regulator [Spirochaetia bacterium]|nr:Rrf2 family transcriptional regulator [Spirochaetia bacterium]
MQITRKTDYAVRCVQYLAQHAGNVTMIGEIAEQMQIPRTFLAKIVQKLGRAGIVVSRRGVNGGFTLGREPEAISLYDVIVVMEGPVVLNACAVRSRECDMSNRCSVHPIWIRLRAEIERKLKSQSFAEFSRAELSTT